MRARLGPVLAATAPRACLRRLSEPTRRSSRSSSSCREASTTSRAIAAVPGVDLIFARATTCADLGHPGDTGTPRSRPHSGASRRPRSRRGCPGGSDPTRTRSARWRKRPQRGRRFDGVGLRSTPSRRRLRPRRPGPPSDSTRAQVRRRRDMRNRVPAWTARSQTRTIDACPPDQEPVDRLLGGAHHNPHAVLGAHPVTRRHGGPHVAAARRRGGGARRRGPPAGVPAGAGA